jgi:predicted dinucleotide-binding enzyme
MPAARHYPRHLLTTASFAPTQPNEPELNEGARIMTTISIIGSGNMATAIGARAAKHGHTVEIMSRNPAKAQAAADYIGNGATVGTFGAQPAGDIVILAVLYASAVDVVAHYGDALAGKILVDITNPFNADGTGVVTTPGNSVSQQIAAAAPKGTHVVKAFNTIFRNVLAEATSLDGLFAGDSAEARARFAEFLESLDMQPRDTGGLDMTYVLEWAAILLMGLARNGAGWDVALSADLPD